MKKELSDRKRKILRRVFGTLSLTSALFVFQACYGAPRDMEADAYLQGIVKSKTTSLPIEGIKVFIESHGITLMTDSAGKFDLYLAKATEYKLKFEDTDSTLNGEFLPADTTITSIDGSVINILLDDK